MAEHATCLRIELRRQLRKHLRSESDFDAFLIDNFPHIHLKVGSAMDRVAKENILLENTLEERIVIHKLQEWIHGLSAQRISNTMTENDQSSAVSILSLQTWTIKSALMIIAVEVLFFAVAPHLGFPLEASEAIRMLEIILPIFLFYLSSAMMIFFEKRLAIHFLSHSGRRILNLLIRGPVFLFVIITFTSIGIFGYSNRLTAIPGEGLSPNSLAALLTISLSILCTLSNAMVLYLFSFSEA